MSEFSHKLSKNFHNFTLAESFNVNKFNDAILKCKSKNLNAIKIIF